MVLGLIGAAIGGIASLSAASKQTKAANSATALQQRVYDETINRLSPFYDAGAQTALPAYLFEMGLGERPSGYEGISLSPAGQFALTEGRDTIEAGAAARGRLFSGATMKGLERFRTDLARSDRDNQLNRMLTLAQMGQNAAAQQGTAGSNFAVNAGNTMMQAGNAASAGIVGASNAINSGINNHLQYQAMNRIFN